MSLIINHNISALNTHRNMTASGTSMAKSIEKLSSGYKINVGGDDPSGLIISEQLRSQISGLERAVRNSSEAFNLIGIAEGALNEMNTILKKMRALAIHAANSGVTSPEQVAADQSEMDSGIETLNRIANTTRYSDQYLLNGQKQLVYDITTSVNEPTDHALLDTKMTRIDQVFKRDGVKMAIGFAGEKSQYQANTKTSAQRAYLEADNAYSLCEVDGANVTANQEFILTGTGGSRLFSFSAGEHLGAIVSGINNVRDSTGIGAALTFASDVRIDRTTNGTPGGSSPNYQTNTPAKPVTGYDDGTYIYQSGDVQIYGAGLNNVATAKISEFTLTPDAASSFKVGFNCDGDGKIYAKVVDKSTNSIEYYKDRNCTMLIGKGDDTFFSATNNSGIPSSPIQSLDGIYMKLNSDNAQDLDVFEIAVVGQRLDNQKDMNVDLAGWTDIDNSVMSGVNLGVNTGSEGGLFYEYVPRQFEADGKTVKTFEINVYKHESREPKHLVATSGIVQNNIKIADPVTGQIAGQTVRVESVTMDDGTNSGLNITLNLPKKGILDGVTGKTVDELKADPYYKQVMAEMSTVKGEYNEIASEYTSAKKARDKAIGDLDAAQQALLDAREKEEKVRREIDRLEARGIDQRIADAQRDLSLAQNDIIDAARDTVYADERNAAYMNVTKASPAAPEKITELLANQILTAINDEVTLGGDPADINWDTRKNAIMASVWTRAPLVGITEGMTDATAIAQLTADANTLLDAAYAAATQPDLVSAVGDAAAEARTLGTLQADYDAANAALTAAKADFEAEVEASVEAVGVNWGTITAGDDLEGLANEIKNALIAFLAGTEADHSDGAVANPATDFTRFQWNSVKQDILTAALAAAAPLHASPEQEAALASDMFDFMVDPGNSAPLTNFATALQTQVKSPAPVLANFQGDIDNQVLDAVKIASLNTGNDPYITTLGNWLDAQNFTWDDLAAEISGLIGYDIDNAIPPYDPANIGTSVQAALKAAVDAGSSTTPITATIIDQLNDTTAASPPGLGGTTELDALFAQIYTRITNTSSAVHDFITKEKAAVDSTNAAGIALGVVNVAPPAPGLVQNAVADAEDTITAIGTESTEGLGAGRLPQAIADAIREQLLVLAEEGMNITVDDNLLAPSAGGTSQSTQDLMVANILDSLTGIADANIGPAALKQLVTEAYVSYVTEAAGGASDGVGTGTDGTFGDYTQLVDTFADLKEIYPHGGAIQRAEDRLTRYAERLQQAPLKAETSASTRKAWDRLVAEYGNNTQANLTKLATDFGAYVRDRVERAAAADAEDSLVWNSSDSTADIYDELRRMMAEGPTQSLLVAIQHDIDNDTDPDVAAAGRAAMADFEKVVQKMFDAVAKPDYNEDVAAAADPDPVLPGEFVFRSPAKKYFDQYNRVQELERQLEAKELEKEGLDEQIEELYDQVSSLDSDRNGIVDGDLVLDLHDASEEFAILSQIADPLLNRISELEQMAKNWLAQAGGGKGFMPEGSQPGSVTFINLGLRVYAVDYGSAETIRIQNKAGNLFYQYRESDSMERLMVEPDKTVQVAGQDAQISLNGAPVFTTGLVADTTTPDFSGSLVFNAGKLGETTLAVAGYDAGKLYSKATALQGVEENEADITELRRHFEPPAMTVPMGDKTVKPAAGMLNKNGNPVNLYMDFSQLDPSVEVKIDNFGVACPIEATFSEPDQLTINANSLGTDPDNMMTITVKVSPDNLRNGYYITEPALKGLFIRTDDLVDLNMSGGDYTPEVAPTTTPEAGDTMLEVNTYATNPRSNTSESMENFIGGMQFQLGNTEGDQDRTVYSIQSMAMSELGRISWNGTEYCLQNVLGGGVASLSKDPILAMRILEQAVDDVSTLRARLGAFQSNMLQSNINSLGVAIENITKTESAIRDTDMAEESTQFTRFQIMQQAGTSMLAQANQVSQNVLSLLQ